MNRNLRLALIILLSGLFLFSAMMVGGYFLNSHKQNTQFQELAAIVNQKRPERPKIPDSTTTPAPETITPDAPTEPVETQSPGPLPEYVEVSAMNPHMVGWMQIEGTKIDYPVMHTPNDPEYYLHKDFYEKYSGHGCLFIEAACDVNQPSDNITIYGHNMKDGSMFATILKYRNKSFWKDHRYIYFDTLNERHTYEVFAVFTTTATKGSGFTYHHFVNASDESSYRNFVDNCKRISLYDTGITPSYGDKLITLSTCEYSQQNGRFVIVARRVV